MKQLRYTLRFTTPAFMGNAEQDAQWRTPPIKALLRQWWRMAYAADKKFAVRVAEMRHEEGLLFGHAWLENDHNAQGEKIAARKSSIRIRLVMPEGLTGDAWSTGTQQGVSPLSKGLETSYAWFGLSNRGNGQPDRNAIAINPKESRRELLLAVPDTHVDQIRTTLQLIHHFGQLGSRSRGGWGSFSLEGIEPLNPTQMLRFAQTLDNCLRHDWPMSLCRGTKGLCLWESKNPFPSWEAAMRAIAIERKNTRIALKSFNGKNLRPILGFATPGRMPSPLRWRVIPSGSGELVIQAYATPTLIPKDGKQHISDEETKDAWREVFRVLDSSTQFSARDKQQ